MSLHSYSGIYYETLDKVGHTYGPESPEIHAAVKDLDTGITYLLDKLDTASLQDEVTVMVFSDHGMKELDCGNLTDCGVPISKLVDVNDLERYFDVHSYWPKPGKLDKVDQTM